MYWIKFKIDVSITGTKSSDKPPRGVPGNFRVKKQQEQNKVIIE